MIDSTFFRPNGWIAGNTGTTRWSDATKNGGMTLGQRYEFSYRLTMVVGDMGLVDMDFGRSTVCPTLLGQMIIWQNRLGRNGGK